MNNIRQMMQARPAKAMDLLAKLLDTSEGALKTRDRLLSELKQELHSMAVTEEQHLFPVLRKHKEMKDLVREAVADNKETKSLLADLERTPKDSEEFAEKVAALRKTLQQHIRDEKKELLPAIAKALSDDEAASVWESMDGSQAKIEETRRAEADERRAEARKEREPLTRAEHVREAISDTLRGEAEMIEHAAEGTAEAIQQGSEQVVQLFGRATEEAGELVQRASEDLRALSQSGEALRTGMRSITREWFDLSQARVQQNFDDLSAVFRSRTLADFVAAHSSMVRHNIEMMVENGQRMMRLSMRTTDKVKQPLEQRARQA